MRSGGSAVTSTLPTDELTSWSIRPLLRRSLRTAVTDAMASAVLMIDHDYDARDSRQGITPVYFHRSRAALREARAPPPAVLRDRSSPRSKPGVPAARELPRR